jgi:hypothetical protein
VTKEPLCGVLPARFDRLVVLRVSGRISGGKRLIECVCDCGEVTYVRLNDLRRGQTRSCGCLAREHTRGIGLARRVHGGWGTPEYVSYRSMLARCYDPAHPSNWRYAALGIKVCGEWLGPEGFRRFRQDMGPRPQDTTLERVDNSGIYHSHNCVWASRRVQNANRNPSGLAEAIRHYQQTHLLPLDDQ